MKNGCDVIVLGLGGMGSATAYQLAARGVKVCGIEQFSPAHDRGSSHGESRIIRKAYFEHPDYMPLLHRAFELWQLIAEASQSTLQVTNGLIVSGAVDSPTIAGLQACYRQHQVPHEQWQPTDLKSHFPQFNIPKEHTVFFDPYGGFLRVEACVQAQLKLAQQLGAVCHFGEKVVSWSASRKGVVVTTAKQQFYADKLIITAGAWVRPLLDELGIRCQIWRKIVVWYTSPGLESFMPDRFPTYYIELPQGGFYGFPVVSDRGLKVAEHLQPQIIDDPDTVDRSLYPEDEQPLWAFVQQVFPQLQPVRTAHSVCLYTKSPDDHFILGMHPQHDRVVIGAGFSGHGFKFAPVIGEILSGLAIDGVTEYPIGFLKLERFLVFRSRT